MAVSAEWNSFRWIHADHAASNDEATEAIDDVCMDLHIATDTRSPWSQISLAPVDGHGQMQAVPQAPTDRIYSAEATRHNENLHMYDQWLLNVSQQGPSNGHQEPKNQSSHWGSPTARLPQDVIDSVENGTVDPRALDLRC